MIFASTMGIGIGISAIPVFIYEGTIAVSAEWLQHFLTPQVISMITATGGVLIMAVALNVMEIKKIRVGNLLPAILIAALIQLVISHFSNQS